MSTHPLIAVCANPKFHYMSPANASMYCSPHPAALHIAPVARLRDFAFRISRMVELLAGDFIAKIKF
jgi:hypothetical protein